MLTILRFPFTIVFLYGSFQSSVDWRIIASLFFLLSMLTDLLDGITARRWDAESKFGSFLDPLADKFLVLAGFFVLLTRPDLHWGAWNLWVLGSVIIIAVREFAVTILRSWKVKSGSPLVTSIWGKAKTMVQMVTLITGLLILNIRDLSMFEIPGILNLIAFGIVLSALLALISATDYFRTSQNSSPESVSNRNS